MRRDKGITLIALIITIVVMLILVAVSVNVIVNSDLIGHTEKIGDAYKNAIAEEEGYNPSIGNGKTLEDYMKDAKIVEEIHNWVRTGDNLTCKCNQCTENGTKPEGRTLTIGQKLNYTTKGGTGSSSISEEKSGIAQAKADGQSWATDLGVQTVNIASDETKWVVLGVEDSNKNGTNETLLLTTQTPTTETIRMYGYQPYNHAVEEINRMCKEIYGTDARGMTIEDVNACLQYVAPAGMCGKDNSGTLVYYTVPEGTTISDLGSSYGDIWTDIQNNTYQEEDGTKKYFTPSCPEGTTDSNVLGKIPVDGYYYHLSDDGTYLVNDANASDTSHTITTVTRNLIFGETKQYDYWLASRGVGAGGGFAGFGPGAVRGGGAFSCDGVFNSDGNEYVGEFGLRPVVSLTSQIPEVGEVIEIDVVTPV